VKIVVKIGGDVVRSPQMRIAAAEIVALTASGHDVVVVHGGGPQATELSAKLGQTPHLVAGRRVTDEAALEVMKMVVAGSVNVDLCAALLRAGGRPVGLHGASSLVLEARRRPAVVVAGGGAEPIDFGWVGDVVGVHRDLLERLGQGGYLPVLACLGADADGRVYNINADVVASKVASELRADALVLLTDVPGVLSDPKDEATRLPRLSESALDEGVRSGRITRGMIPKLTESFEAVRAGVRAVVIVGRLAPGDLSRALHEPGSVGTWLEP
jgi:acetylglutamate kinase